jgi:cupin superfamily acireductone dioxygenase involved in methionine salvage
MQVKKSGKIIFGADFTAEEKKAIDIEIKKQLAEFDKKHEIEIDALILWTLHQEFGFGEKRLKQFYYIFGKAIDELIKRYEFDDSDRIWICTEKLKDYGIDLEEWAKER